MVWPETEAEAGAVDADTWRRVVVVAIVVVAARIVAVAVVDDHPTGTSAPAFAGRVTHDSRLVQQAGISVFQ